MYDLLINFFFDVEPVNIHMLDPIMIQWVMSNTNGRFIGSSLGIFNSFKIALIHSSLSIPLDKARNSASVLDFDTILCFLLLYVTKSPELYSPRNLELLLLSQHDQEALQFPF